MEIFGDKVAAKKWRKNRIPTLSGTEKPVQSEEELVQIAEEIGYPIILKAPSAEGSGCVWCGKKAD